jgi:hypothetical protein
MGTSLSGLGRMTIDGAVHGGAEPRDVRVPPQRTVLLANGELVHVALPALDLALSNVRRPVRAPARDAVPAHQL